MKSSTRVSTFTFPVRTYLETMSGKTSVSNCWQNGHWRSMYSIIVTGAFGLPSVMPFCGMPLKVRSTSGEPGRPEAIDPIFGTPAGVDDPPPPVKTTTSTTIDRDHRDSCAGADEHARRRLSAAPRALRTDGRRRGRCRATRLFALLAASHRRPG